MKEKDCCRKCGHAKTAVSSFFEVIGKPPWRDNIYICGECLDKLKKSKTWPLYGKVTKLK